MNETMKPNLISTFVVAGLALACCSIALAEEKEKTITGEGVCAKCELKETKSCQAAIQVTEGGKPVTYHLVQNEVSKKFQNSFCQKPARVKATGAVTTVDGKLELTASSIELVKR